MPSKSRRNPIAWKAATATVVVPKLLWVEPKQQPHILAWLDAPDELPDEYGGSVQSRDVNVRRIQTKGTQAGALEQFLNLARPIEVPHPKRRGPGRPQKD